MSSALTQGVISSFKKGKQILQNVLKTKTQKVIKVAKSDGPLHRCKVNRSPVLSTSQQIWRGILPRVYYNSLAAQLGRQAAWRAGRRAPLLAFFGLAVSSQHGDNSEDEITDKIQDFLKAAYPEEQSLWDGLQQLSLANFEFGPRIGQGCNAAVYGARWKSDNELSENDTEGDITFLSNKTDSNKPESTNVTSESNNLILDMEEAEETEEHQEEDNSMVGPLIGCFEEDIEYLSDNSSDTDSDITVISSDSDEDFWYEEGAPVTFTIEKVDEDDEANMTDSSSSMEDSADDEFEIIDVTDQSDASTDETLEQAISPMVIPSQMIDLMLSLDEGHAGHEGLSQETDTETYQSMNSSVMLDDGRTRPKLKYDLAVKMMFNYDVESNVTAIVKSMEKETVPSRVTSRQECSCLINNRNKGRIKSLPPHPNIVEMWGMFVDPIPCLSDSLINYPAAMPSKFNPDGMGRNMTMFLVMKRYDTTLTDYLSWGNPTFRERVYLLVQLLEAVDHLCKHGISHRDMKTDNILLDISKEGTPQLVLSDFGCCLADPTNGLVLPYYTDEIDKGGNRALMAPEIVLAEPGPKSKLDYRKADLWSVGAIGYEILGANNPFYNSEHGKLDSQSYLDTELPPLRIEVPLAIQTVIYSLLAKDPSKRPTARQALNLLYTHLWMPSNWQNTEVTRSEVAWWTVTMATHFLLKGKVTAADGVEMLLMELFLKNLKFRQLLSALQDMGTRIV